MTAVTALERGRDFTRADLDDMPDDGRRYELVDGTLLVSPAPRFVHQLALRRLVVRLAGACPADLVLLFAPFDVALSDTTVMQPDLLVARREDFTDRDLPTAPLLAVEVLSPSTRRFDLLVKRSRYEEAGCASYWVVDPDEPSITAWNLGDGGYGEPTVVTGDEAYAADRPFPVEVVPTALTR